MEDIALRRFARRRWAALTGFGAASAVLGLASTSFACTYYYGKSTVTDVNNGVTSTAWADGAGGSEPHAFCAPGGVPTQFQPLHPVDLTGQFTVGVGSTTLCTTATQAPDANFGINWSTPKPDVDQDEVYVRGHCDANDNNLTSIGSMNVTNGVGSASVSVPTAFPGGPAAVCFESPLGPTGDSPPEVRLLVI